MILLQILWNIIIAPLELIFEIIFGLALRVSHSEVVAIILLSLVVSTLVLPLYMRAEKIETEERNKEKEMSGWVAHIKKHFKGDEKYMMLNAYYRENHYSPVFQLRSSISILLQIPFFMAAYNFLGERAPELFTQKDFFCAPDGFISIGSISINVLPILMTLINLAATFIYTRGLPLRTIIRSLILPLVFLVLLYNSPCSLLIYWTMNNLYSLIKTIIIKNAGIKIQDTESSSGKKEPAVSGKYKKRIDSFFEQETKSVRFILPAVFMAVLTGLMIPLAYLSASPEEFVSASNPQNPLMYLISSLFVSTGFFVLWPTVFYCLASRKTKHVMSVIAIGGAVFSAFNYLFGANTGTINTVLVFDRAPVHTVLQKVISIFIFLFVVAACSFLYRFRKTVSIVFIAAILTTVTIAVINAKKVNDAYRSIISHIDDFREEEAPRITLSANGKNVMVIMLDRGVSGLIPYVFHEFPEIKEQFDGFTDYPNSVSFGLKTLTASSALFGGYEYTPERMDARADVSLKTKHDESLKVLPRLFSDQGYHSTLMDLPYPGWTWIGDYSSFDDIENCDSYHAVDYFSNNTEWNNNIENRRNRNLFMYSVFRCVPMCLQEFIYDQGEYLAAVHYSEDIQDILQPYRVLENLSNMTHIDHECSGCLFLFNNETTHDVAVFKNYDPREVYSAGENYEGYYISDGNREVYLEEWLQVATYGSTVAALRELGNYFDYLRECGVYDNTRIIIVSDHGIDIDLSEELNSEDFSAENFNCMFLVKDFGSSGFRTDYTFMTNADVPAVATKGIIDNPVNPYTGKPVNSDLKNEDIYVGYSLTFDEKLWNPDRNKGNTFYYDENYNWYKVINKDIFVKENWVKTDKPGL